MANPENGFKPAGAEQFRAPRAEVNGNGKADALPAAGEVKEVFFAGNTTAAKLEASRIQADAARNPRMALKTRLATGRR